MKTLLCKLLFFVHCAAPYTVPSTPTPLLVTAASSTCTYTKDANDNVILGPGCTDADIFVNAGASDFHLVPGSPAINNAVCLVEVLTDFDGNPRPTPGRGCDIGAYQFVGASVPPSAPTGLTVTGVKP